MESSWHPLSYYVLGIVATFQLPSFPAQHHLPAHDHLPFPASLGIRLLMVAECTGMLSGLYDDVYVYYIIKIYLYQTDT